MPTVTPLPSTLKALRAEAAPSWVSPSEVTSPWQVLAAVIGASASVTPSTPARAPIWGRIAGRANAATVP